MMKSGKSQVLKTGHTKSSVVRPEQGQTSFRTLAEYLGGEQDLLSEAAEVMTKYKKRKL